MPQLVCERPRGRSGVAAGLSHESSCVAEVQAMPHASLSEGLVEQSGFSDPERLAAPLTPGDQNTAIEKPKSLGYPDGESTVTRNDPSAPFVHETWAPL
jgi:hypothetical protein